MSTKLSIIIPIGPNESALGVLVDSLLLFSTECIEVIFVLAEGANTINDRDQVVKQLTAYRNRWLSAPVGRAQQMNAGAQAAEGQYLWFLHLDSRFGRDLVKVLFDTLSMNDGGLSLFYFQLNFYDGPKSMRLNTVGANWRSRCLKLPFGDQGFLIARDHFKLLGGFSERTNYGEDHLLVWSLLRNRGKVIELPATLSTSARKYQEHGWFKQSVRHQYLWLMQCLPQLCLFFKSRLNV